MKTETEIREVIEQLEQLLKMFGESEVLENRIHALKWVVGDILLETEQ